MCTKQNIITRKAENTISFHIYKMLVVYISNIGKPISGTVKGINCNAVLGSVPSSIDPLTLLNFLSIF